MDALRTSFMLLPDFSFLPDRDIDLGSVIPAVPRSKLPNPQQRLTAALLVADDVSTQEYTGWSWDSVDSLSPPAADSQPIYRS